MRARKNKAIYALGLAAVLAAGVVSSNVYANNRKDAEKSYNKMHKAKEELRAAKEELRRIHSKNANWANTQSNSLGQIDQAFKSLDAADNQIKQGIQGIND